MVKVLQIILLQKNLWQTVIVGIKTFQYDFEFFFVLFDPAFNKELHQHNRAFLLSLLILSTTDFFFQKEMIQSTAVMKQH